VTETAPPVDAAAASLPPAAQPSPASVVVSQSPAPGGKVLAGSAVNFEVR
jgi:hypothetical protein